MKIIVWVATDRVGSKMEREIDVDEDEWTQYNDKEKDEYVWDEITNHLCLFQWGYREP